jgi:hypothetical protein
MYSKAKGKISLYKLRDFRKGDCSDYGLPYCDQRCCPIYKCRGGLERGSGLKEMGKNHDIRKFMLLNDGFSPFKAELNDKRFTKRSSL